MPRPPSPPRFTEGDRVVVSLPGDVLAVAAPNPGRPAGPGYEVVLDPSRLRVTPEGIVAACEQSQLRRAPSARRTRP